MKLIGSMLEEQIEESLIGSRIWLLNSDEGAKILEVLETAVGKVKTAYMLTWTPDQAEDFYNFLVNGKVVVGFELPRPYHESEACGVEVEDVRTYRRHLKGRPDNIQLLIALKLSEKDIAEADDQAD